MNGTRRYLTKYLIALSAIVLLGAFLRIYHLSTQSIWGDEAASVWISSLNLPQIVEVTAGDVSPPFYYFVLHYWMLAAGSSESALRLLSVIFGILAIPIVYAIGHLLFDREVGLVAALILALSSFNITYSQDLRMYSLMVLLALLSMYFFLRYVRTATLALSFGYLLSTMCLAYTHVYGLFVIIAQNAYVVVLLLWSREHTLRTRNWIALQVIVVALFAPWIPVMMAQIAGSQISSKPHLITTATIVPTLVATFKAYSGSVVLLCLFLALSLLSLFAYHAKGGAAGWKTPFRALHFDLSHVNGTGLAAVSFLIIWLFTLNVLPMVICLESALVYVVRYSIAASVALYLLVAVGIRNLSVLYIKVAVVGIVIVLCAAPLPAYYTTIVNPQAREVIHSVDEHVQAGDAVLVWPESHIVVWAYYNTKAEINATTFGSPTKSIDENAKELNSSLSGSPRVWFICADYGRDPRVSAILKIFNESYETASYTHYVGYNLYLFVKRG